MARFASEAELETFLGRLEPDYSPSASTLWQQGVKTAFQLANARESILLACGLSELYIDDIKARADRTGELNALSACTVCLMVHQGILLVRSGLVSFVSVFWSHIFNAVAIASWLKLMQHIHQ